MSAPLPTWDMVGLYLDACRLDVECFKPGNVSLASPGHGMTAQDFVRSATCSAPVLLDPALTLGQRILGAIEATQAAVGCNTNLGIVLLVAPLVQACVAYPHLSPRSALQKVLTETTLDDAQDVYVAIRCANPGGLGHVQRQDVAAAPAVCLRDAMTLAADRDMIARQYANGFSELFDVALPYLRDARAAGDVGDATTDLYLFMLARYPDTHIQRKHGAVCAAEISARAAELHCEAIARRGIAGHRAELRAFDVDLKRRGINPGTTADLCVATHFLHGLLLQASTHAGRVPDHPRSCRPERAEVPHFRAAK